MTLTHRHIEAHKQTHINIKHLKALHCTFRCHESERWEVEQERQPRQSKFSCVRKTNMSVSKEVVAS